MTTPTENSSLRMELLGIGDDLNLPVYKPPVLHVDYEVQSNSDRRLPVWHQLPTHPSAASDIHEVRIISARVLTRNDSVKTTLEVSLDITDKDLEFEPGDTFGLLCQNNAEEVVAILSRFNLLSNKDIPCKISSTTSKASKIPKHIPPRTTSLFDLFIHFVDIRAVPKKVLLRILAEHTDQPNEKQRLLQLSSRQGSKHYLDFVVGPKISLLDLLNSFPSCLPPVECLLENLPALQPRAYSIINSPLVDDNCLKFVFNVVEIPAENGRTYDRFGIGTKWIDDLTKPIQRRCDNDREEFCTDEKDRILNEGLSQLSISGDATTSIGLPIFVRKFKDFRLPKDHSKPLILIGPGTGVAPFIGFLEHRSAIMKAANKNGSTSGIDFCKVLLFYGCRHKDRDFLYKDRLEAFERDGILSELIVCFSRDKVESDNSKDGESTNPGYQPPRYVQDSICDRGCDVFRLIDEERAFVFVCGDAKGMANDINESIVSVVQIHGGLDESDARKYVKSLQGARRYLQDIWT